jgi:hypothetical protein
MGILCQLRNTRLGSPRRDELEPLDGVNGLWTSDPAGVVLLLCSEQDSATQAAYPSRKSLSIAEVFRIISQINILRAREGWISILRQKRIVSD